jgi:hypothetical protein
LPAALIETRPMKDAHAMQKLLMPVLACILMAWPVQAQDESPSAPLQGRIEESGVEPSHDVIKKTIEAMPAPVLKPRAAGIDKAAPLQGSAKGGGLKGSVEDSEAGAIRPMQGQADKKVLQGHAAKEGSDLKGLGDPDADDRELMVEWDRWRNRLLFAIQSGMQESLNNPDESNLRWDPKSQTMVAKFPMGTITWFFCQVTPDRRIQNLKITHSSGFPGYDKAVLESINNLQGSSILRYPKGSKRMIVTQEAGIKTAETAEYRYFKFGDVERQRF